MSGTMLHLIVAFLCIASLSAAPANETVTYENSSPSSPSDPNVLSSVDIIVPREGNSSLVTHMSPVEVDTDHHEEDHHHSSEASSTESQNSTSLSPLSFDDEDTQEMGPTTKSTHIMIIPPRNATAMSENATDYSAEEDALASSHEHDHESKGSFMASTSIFVVLATVSGALIIQ